MMDQSKIFKLKACALLLAIVSLNACSSSQVDDLDAPPADAAAGDVSGNLDAQTDAVPGNQDPGAVADAGAPPAGDPNAAPPAGDAPPAGGDVPPPAVADAGASPPDMGAPPAANPADAGAPPPATAGGDVPPPAVADAGAPPPVADPAPATGSAPDALAANPNPPAQNNDFTATNTTATAPVTDTGSANTSTDTTPVAASAGSSGDAVQYKVRRGDTLMKIAFEQYGDLYRWKEIYEANRTAIQDPNHVPPGTKLSLNGAGMVTIERNGEKYLIKHGDTLGSISNDVYGTKRKWKKLWENNRQLIKDPNHIYAGFYLYYQPEARLTHGQEGGSEDSAANAPQAETAPTQQTAQAMPFNNQGQAPVNTAANTATAQPAAVPAAANPAQAGAPGARTPASK